MALTVGTNSGALMAQAAASSVNKSMENSMERLATGKRINAASDDAAGVAIASRLTSEIRGTNQAIRNAMDGQALIDTAEGAQKEVENLLQRMRELAVQSSNDTNNASDRANLQLEMTSLVSEIDRISSTTTWAGTKLLDGSDANGFSFQVGSRTAAADTITAVIASTSSAALGVGAISLGTIKTVGAVPDATTAGKMELTANETNSITLGGKTFTAGMSVQTGTGNVQLAIQTATVRADITLTDSGSTSGAAGTFVVNGVTINYTSTGAAGTGATAIKAAFDSAKTGNTELSHITATVATNDIKFTSTASNIATNLVNKINADSDIAAKFSVAGTGTDTLTFSVKTTASVTSVGTNTIGSTATGGVTVAASTNTTTGKGTFTVTADATVDTAIRNNTINLTLDGVTVAYNTFTDGVEKGFARTHTTTGGQAGGHAAGIIQKFKDAGLTGVSMTSTAAGVISASKGGQAVDISTTAGAATAIDAIDVAIQTVGNQRAVLGATSNRLDSTVSNLTNIATNLSAGRGRIEDADFAAETTSLAKSQILQQASTAMLAQANASKQGVLSLLQG
jgi:flagellin